MRFPWDWFKPATRPVSGDSFKDILDEVYELHLRKSADYGTDEDQYANYKAAEEFGIPPWVGVMVRCADKFQRVKTFVRKGELVNESVEDSLVDIITHTVCALDLYRQDVRAGVSTALRPMVPSLQELDKWSVPSDADRIRTYIAKRDEDPSGLPSWENPAGPSLSEVLHGSDPPADEAPVKGATVDAGASWPASEPLPDFGNGTNGGEPGRDTNEAAQQLDETQPWCYCNMAPPGHPAHLQLQDLDSPDLALYTYVIQEDGLTKRL